MEFYKETFYAQYQSIYIKKSSRKIATPEPQNVLGTDGEPSGFRLIDLSILSSIFKLLPCGECKQLTLEMFENVPKRKGCASSLELRCQGCSWRRRFIPLLKRATSSK